MFVQKIKEYTRHISSPPPPPQHNYCIEETKAFASLSYWRLLISFQGKGNFGPDTDEEIHLPRRRGISGLPEDGSGNGTRARNCRGFRAIEIYPLVRFKLVSIEM